MELEHLRRLRRVASAAVSLSAVALVMAKVGASAERSRGLGLVASVLFPVSFVLLVLLWRKEQAAAQAAFAERERQQLELFRLQLEQAKKKASAEQQPGAEQEPEGTRQPDAAPLSATGRTGLGE